MHTEYERTEQQKKMREREKKNNRRHTTAQMNNVSYGKAKGIYITQKAKKKEKNAAVHIVMLSIRSHSLQNNENVSAHARQMGKNTI